MSMTQSNEERDPGHVDHGAGPKKGHEVPEPGPDVKIWIGRDAFTIHRGSHTVAEIKALGGVPLADDLVQIVNGQLVPLADDGRVTIKGGERFKSHPKDSGAS